MKYLPAEAYERYDHSERATPADFIEARHQGGTKGHAGEPLQWEQASRCATSSATLLPKSASIRSTSATSDRAREVVLPGLRGDHARRPVSDTTGRGESRANG
jgi:hypothetical protein